MVWVRATLIPLFWPKSHCFGLKSTVLTRFWPKIHCFDSVLAYNLLFLAKIHCFWPKIHCFWLKSTVLGLKNHCFGLKNHCIGPNRGPGGQTEVLVVPQQRSWWWPGRGPGGATAGLRSRRFTRSWELCSLRLSLRSPDKTAIHPEMT